MAERLYNVEPIERFNSKYIIDEETNCWNWIASLNTYGYGKFTLEGKEILAHRFAYKTFVGPLMKGLVCCHNCHNRKCCNPEHLRQDTHSSNHIDQSYQNTNPSQKLSVDEVIEIKKELKNYYRGQFKDLSHFYKVDPETISSIKKGKIWSHVKI